MFQTKAENKKIEDRKTANLWTKYDTLFYIKKSNSNTKNMKIDELFAKLI